MKTYNLHIEVAESFGCGAWFFDANNPLIFKLMSNGRTEARISTRPFNGAFSLNWFANEIFEQTEKVGYKNKYSVSEYETMLKNYYQTM
jgi:hypothetical protein